MAIEKKIIYYKQGHISGEEMETSISISRYNDQYGLGTTVIADTTYLPDYRKFVKQGWICVEEYRYEDETVCGGRFIGNRSDVSIRNSIKAQRERCFTEEHKQKIIANLQNWQNKQKKADNSK